MANYSGLGKTFTWKSWILFSLVFSANYEPFFLITWCSSPLPGATSRRNMALQNKFWSEQLLAQTFFDCRNLNTISKHHWVSTDVLMDLIGWGELLWGLLIDKTPGMSDLLRLAFSDYRETNLLISYWMPDGWIA